MKSAERRISQLERLLKRERGTNALAPNLCKIGYIEFRLSQLYKLEGAAVKAEEMLNDAYLTIQDPACRKNRKSSRLLSVISYCRDNPMAPPLVELPPILRYLSPIILLTGYVITYLVYLAGLLSYELFFVLIFAVFAISMVVTSVLSSSYVKQTKSYYMSHRPKDQYAFPNSRTAISKGPDDVVDDAKAEISLAGMYYSLKQYKEMELHIEKAKTYLNDPLSIQSNKREEALGSLSSLEKSLLAIKEKKSPG